MRFPNLNRAGISLLLGITSGLLWGGVYSWASRDTGGAHLLLWVDANLYGQFFLWRGPQEPHPDVVILAIDETSQNLADLFTVEELEVHPTLSQMTRSPWPRAVFAAVLEQLGSAGAKVVAFDVIFDQASVYGPEDDRIFAEVIGQYAQQTLFAVSRSEEVQILPGGSRSVRVDLTPLWPDYAVQNPRLGLVNLPLSPNRQVLTLPGAMDRDPERLPFALAATGQAAPREALGINYRGPQGTYPTFPLWYLFEPSFWQFNLANGAVFQDKIVLIGDTTQLGQDLWNTPWDPLMPGVEIHANAVGTLLAGNGIRPLPWGWGSLLILVSGVGMGLGLGFCRGVLPKMGLTFAWGG